jgi:hypothetical protein
MSKAISPTDPVSSQDVLSYIYRTLRHATAPSGNGGFITPGPDRDFRQIETITTQAAPEGTFRLRTSDGSVFQVSVARTEAP